MSQEKRHSIFRSLCWLAIGLLYTRLAIIISDVVPFAAVLLLYVLPVVILGFVLYAHSFGTNVVLFGYKLKHIVDPVRWFMVVQSFVDPERHASLSYCEQIVFRKYKCPACLTRGKCYACNCALPQAMENPNLSCSREEWDPVQNEMDWELHKSKFGITISVTQETPYPEALTYPQNHK